YQMSGLETINDGLNIAIRGQDDILSSDVFYGDESTFTHPGAVVMPVSAGGSLWEIAAAPTAMGTPYGIWILRSTLLVVWLLLCVLLILRFRQFIHNQALRAIIFRNERFLRAVETVSRVGGWRWSDGVFTEVSPQARAI